MEALAQARNTVSAGEYLRAKTAGEDAEKIAAAIERAREEVEAAKKAVDSAFYELVFRGIPESDFEALAKRFPPTEEQIEQARAAGEELPIWDEDEFPLALLEVCTLESDLTMDGWREELAGWTRAERQEITARVLECNLRSFSAALDFE